MRTSRNAAISLINMSKNIHAVPIVPHPKIAHLKAQFKTFDAVIIGSFTDMRTW